MEEGVQKPEGNVLLVLFHVLTGNISSNTSSSLPLVFQKHDIQMRGLHDIFSPSSQTKQKQNSDVQKL